MNDDMRDEVPVPHFEEDLWQTLAQVHAEQRRDRAGGPVTAPPVTELRHRRRARRTFLAGVGAIAAAAALLAAIVVTGSDDDSPGTEAGGDPTTTAEAPPMSLAAQITAATQEASANSIVYKYQDHQYLADDGTPIGDAEDWTDEQSGAFRSLSLDSEGRPSFDTGRAVAPAVDDPGPPPIPPGAAPFDPSLPQERLRQVDYCFAEYTEYDQAAIPGHNEADRIGEWLEQGSLVEDGTEIVDGREVIRLVEVPVDLQQRSDGRTMTPATTTAVPTTDTVPPPTTTPGSPDPTYTVPAGPTTTEPDAGAPLDPDTFEYVEHIYLVDAETLRPVRIIGYPGEAPDYSDATYIATIEYLPRTPENMELLVAPAPDGFELVADLRGDGERYDRCGW